MVCWIGALSVQSSLKGPGTVLLAAPVCLMAIPSSISGAAIVRRKLTGRSIFSTDQRTCTIAYGQVRGPDRRRRCRDRLLLSAIAALSSLWWKNESFAAGDGGMLVLFFVSTRISAIRNCDC
ncbi:MAG: hypothetical protein U0992_24555 [Planctomycetaceae bacterium]